MPDFVQAQITQDPTLLLDAGIDSINSNLAANGYQGWSPSDADLAVIILAIVGQWAADLANIAATVLPAVFRAFGTALFKLAYGQGTYATVTTTWTFTSPAPTGGYTIAAGKSVLVGGQAFYVQTQVVTNTGDTTATVGLVASQTGAAFNGLGGISQVVTPVDQTDWVSSIVTVGPSSGGADQDTDAAYQTKLVNVLALQAPRPITATDFPSFLLSSVCASQTGITVGRATGIDGYYPAPRALSTGGAGSTVLSCTTVNASPTVTVVTNTAQVAHVGATVTGTGIPAGATVLASPAPTLTSFTISANATVGATNNLTVSQMDNYGPSSLTCNATFGNASPTVTINTGPYPGSVPFVGAKVTGTGIPAGATVLASPAPTATGFTMSQNSSSAQTGITVTIDQWSTVQRTVTSFVTDVNGNALSAASMDALSTWLQGFREGGFIASVQPPSTSLVYVTVAVHPLPGYVAATVATAVQNALLTYLNTASWGAPPSGPGPSNTWLNSGSGFNVVRYNKLLTIVGKTLGVDYVSSLTFGLSASPGGSADITLPGPAPLASSSAASIVSTTV
ncbi:MAG: baseplate J/gp47 family protein [Candidatus Eremiobacteraeota bacterium]|nr:baseplate J/gp47 family protein [Candidatus Eremiobacteraeota bacterium]